RRTLVFRCLVNRNQFVIRKLRFEVSSCAVGAVLNATTSGCDLGRSLLTGAPGHRHCCSGSSQFWPTSLWNHPAFNGPRGDICLVSGSPALEFIWTNILGLGVFRRCALVYWADSCHLHRRHSSHTFAEHSRS